MPHFLDLLRQQGGLRLGGLPLLGAEVVGLLGRAIFLRGDATALEIPLQLSEPRLHWCKLYGGNFAATGVKFGVSIDGQKSREAEAEIATKFGPPPPGEWEFRQFLAVRHTGDADEKTTAELRARAAAAFGPEKPARSGWFSRLLGRG